MAEQVVERFDGTSEEKPGAILTAAYAEDSETGLWTVQVFEHDIPEWRETAYATLEDRNRDGCR